ncbi:hypothetical protein [Ahrensia marina]|uniref:Uncharacterized protein n=1 Tax=Ahrensia marina TaxID=1514904 RepID=A0A0M9GLM8_9HYPH|nr:hypothetical protein [Ahrensia marina]KPB00653.1 hypothetical protein SU32_12615 [Ahrensia marina]
MFQTLTEMKLNAIGVVAVALMCSSFTLIGSYLIEQILLRPVPELTPILSAVPSASVLECTEGVYSPVQRRCVSQDIFDAEMKRLFSALGIDTAVYDQQTQSE